MEILLAIVIGLGLFGLMYITHMVRTHGVARLLRLRASKLAAMADAYTAMSNEYHVSISRHRENLGVGSTRRMDIVRM